MEFSWLVTAALGLVILYFVYWLATLNSNYWEKRGVPTVKSPPLTGVMAPVILMRKGFGEIFNDLYHTFDGQKFGGYFQFFNPSLMIRDPELINQVLIKDFTYFEDRGPPIKQANDLFSMSLSNLTGDEWRNVRHKLTPTFTSGKLKLMFASIKECSEEVASYLESKTGQDFEARDLMLRYIINVIGNVAFGLRIDTLNEKDEQSNKFFEVSSKFFAPSLALFFKLMITTSLPKLRNFLKVKLMDSDVEIFFRKLTEDIIKYREQTNTRRNDFLQLMLDLREKDKELLNKGINSFVPSQESEPVESEDKELLDQLKNTPKESSSSSISEIFTDDFISSQTFLFISGGSETTATVLSFVFYELAVNQDLQKKIQDEISNVLSSQEFNYQAIRKMTYMEQFINETLRIHPLTAALVRVCTRDYKIPGTDVVIEKGTFVSIPISGLHKDPQHFPDPEKFNPDRFEDMDSIPKGTFFSFGSGPRICIAMRLAMLEMKVLLATLLMKYTVTLSKKTKTPLKMVKNALIIKADGGIWVNFHKREV